MILTSSALAEFKIKTILQKKLNFIRFQRFLQEEIELKF